MRKTPICLSIEITDIEAGQTQAARDGFRNVNQYFVSLIERGLKEDCSNHITKEHIDA